MKFHLRAFQELIRTFSGAQQSSFVLLVVVSSEKVQKIKKNPSKSKLESFRLSPVVASSHSGIRFFSKHQGPCFARWTDCLDFFCFDVFFVKVMGIHFVFFNCIHQFSSAEKQLRSFLHN